MPLTKPGASAPQNVLAVSTGLVDRALRRDRRVARRDVGMEHLEQRDAQDGALERGDPVERPALRVALDVRVELLA